MSNDTPAVVQRADEAYEAIRAINHLTYATHPAPTVYAVLGNLHNVGHMLAQAADQLGAGLARSLDEYDVYEAGDADPAERVAEARSHLADAITAAGQLGDALARAQAAIALQGYRTDEGSES